MLPLLTALAVGLLLVYNRVFAVPTHIRHLPRVPILPLILSYVSGETEERRTLRLLLPCAQAYNSGLVLVWAFGLWIVHCVDPKVCSTHCLLSSSKKACICEGLRFHCPATTTMPRVAQVPVDVCGQTIPPDTPVVLNMYGVHHNPSVWRDSDTFDPERFLRRSDSAVEDASEATEEATEFEDDLENGWLPFGVGPRSCPARAFSLLEQKTLLAVLLREFEWSLPENFAHSDHIRVAFSVFSLNLPHNLDIIFTKLGKECTTMVEDFNN